MRRWVMLALAGALLACSGAMTDIPGLEDVAGDDDDDDDDDEQEDYEAKDPLPDVEADEDERLDDCQPETYEDWQPMLAAEQSNGNAPEVEASANRIVETVVMKNGMMVRVERGGCTHAGETWWVSPAPKGPVVKAMKKVLSHLDLGDEETASVERCLDEAPDPPPKNGWAAGDSHCSYTKEGKVLSFVHDFAL